MVEAGDIKPGDIKICMTLARAKNGVIGFQGKVPWRLPADLKRFKAITMGKPIVMGRVTFEDDLGKALPGRLNIVVTSNTGFSAEGVRVAHSLDAAIEVATQGAIAAGVDEIHIIGGAILYRAALERADRIYLTEVQISPDGDTFMPAFDEANWECTAREDHPMSDGAPAYSFLTLERR